MDPSVRLAGRVLVAGFRGLRVPTPVVDALADDALAGVILFRRNLAPELEAVGRRNRALVADAARPPLIAVDQEGGRVARLGPPVLPLPPMRALGGLDDAALTEAAAALLGRQLRALGVTVNFAPVLDVDSNPDNPVIGDRSFGSSPDLVARHGAAFARGLARGGVVACGKHFPGHGDTKEDSHLELPRLPHDRARLDRVELVPFRALAGTLPMLMTAHVLFDAVDPTRPATLSAKVLTELLRGELAFGGVIVSDDLEMRAMTDHRTVPEAAVAAVAAGCDLLLVCHHPEQLFAAREALAAETRRSAAFRARLEDAGARVDALRDGLPAPTDDDPAALLAGAEGRRLRARLP